MSDINPYGNQQGQAGQAAPGWYPTGDGFQRYWDGQQWTEHQAPVAAQPGQAVGYGITDTTSDDRTMALFAHLGGMLFGFLVPLIIYLIKKDESPFIREHSAEALNFHLTMLIGWLVSFVLAFVLIGLLLMPVLFVITFLFGIIASIAANKGERYQYPLKIPFVT